MCVCVSFLRINNEWKGLSLWSVAVAVCARAINWLDPSVTRNSSFFQSPQRDILCVFVCVSDRSDVFNRFFKGSSDELFVFSFSSSRGAKEDKRIREKL